MTMLLVNLPVTDLERAKAFYTAVGFPINPAFTDHNAACVFVEENHSAIMLLTREYVQTFTDLPLGNPAVRPAVRHGGRRRPCGGRLGAAPRHGLRLHVPAAAQRPRRQHPRVRLHGPGCRRTGSGSVR